MSSLRRVLGLASVLAGSAACGGDSGSTKPPESRAAVVTALTATNNQSATVGTTLSSSPGVHVTDANGVSVPNVAVTFAVTGGGGTITGSSATTDANGTAFVGSWKLGDTPGANTMTASVSGLPAVTFTATGVAGTAALLKKNSTEPQSAGAGTVVTPAPSVMVTDALGNPIAGITVTFALTGGGGTVIGGAASTNASGVATVGSWTLGGIIAINGLRASVPGLPAVDFTVVAVPGPAATVVTSPSSATLLVADSLQISVSARDQFSNAITNPAATYATSDANVATVTGGGLVRAVGAGQASINVTVGTVTRGVAITVEATTHPATGALSRRISGIFGRPFGVAISASGLIAATQQDLNTVTLVDSSGTSPRSVGVGGDPGDVVFNRTGSRAWVSNFNSGTVSIVDVASGSVIGTIAISSNAYRLALSGDETRLFVTSTDGKLYVLNLATNQVSVVATLGGSLQGMTADATRSFLYVTSSNGNVFRVSMSSLTVTTSQFIGGTPQDVAIAPNGTDLYVADEFAGSVAVLDASTLTSKARISTGGRPFGMAITPDGAQLYVASAGTSQVFVVDVATSAVVKTLSASTPRRIAFDRAGRVAVIANEGGFVDVIR